MIGIKKNSFTKAVLFFFAPFVAFIYSLFDIRSRSSAFVFIGFVALFGYAFAFQSDGPDSYRYAVGFYYSEFNSIDDVIDLYRSGKLRDFYYNFLFVVISQFTKNPKVLFGVAGAIYGWIMYLSVKSLKEQMTDVKDRYTIILFFIFFSLVPITGLNGFKFWTGAWFLYFSTLQFIVHNKLKWSIGVLITPLFHYSFIIVLPAVFLYKLIQRFMYNTNGVNKLLILFFVVTFLLTWILDRNTIQIGFIQKYISLDAVNSRLDYVSNSEGAQETYMARRAGSFFLTVRTYFEYSVRIFMFILIMYLNRLIKIADKTTIDKGKLFKLLAFVLFFTSVGYLAYNISSGHRFLSTFYLFAIFLTAKIYALTKDRGLKKLLFIAIPVFSFEFLFFSVYLPISLATHYFWWAGLPVILADGYGFVFELLN